MVRHGRPLGREAAIRSGLKRSRGEVVVLRDEKHGFRVLEHSAEPPKHASSHPTRPNYLDRLKRFALGE